MTARALCGCAAFSLAVIAGGEGVAVAQVISPPPRSVGGLFGGRRPTDPNRTSQELTLSASLLGGLDDSVAPGGTEGVSLDPLASQRAGMSGVASGEMRYWRGKLSQSLEVRGRGYVNGFRNLGIRPLVGGDGSVSAFVRIKDRLSLNGVAQLQYQPTFMFSTQSVLGDVGAPAIDPTNGVTELRSVNGDAVLSLTQDWSVRQSTTAAATYGRRQYTAITALDTTTQMANVSHRWDFQRSVGLEGSYRYSDQLTVDSAGLERPLESHTATLGLNVRRRLSPTRTLVITGGGGAMQVDTISASNALPFEYTAPSAFGSVRVDLGRSWAFFANVNRSTSVIEGITRQTFLTTDGTLWAGGNLTRRLSLAFTGSFSDGTPHEGETGSFQMLSGAAQVQYSVSRSVSLVGSYAYYEHVLRDVAAVPIGFPRRAERNSLRFGVNVWLPLYGAFPVGGRAGGRN